MTTTQEETVATSLPAFVAAHTERGECQCGQCIDRGNRPDPTGHTVEVGFFKVALRADESKERLAETLRRLTAEHPGEFAESDPFDGKEHSYIELGAWLGDQGVALRYMALGALIGVFRLLTPRAMLGADIDPKLEQDMAGSGFVTVAALQ